MTVYLLHLDQPYKHAKHYTGSADDLDPRLARHAAGRGARLLAVVRAAGIGWQLARTWPGGRVRERQLKRQGGASRRCPLCGIRPRPRPPAVAGLSHPPVTNRPVQAPECDSRCDSAERWYWARAELPGAPPEVDISSWPEPPF